MDKAHSTTNLDAEPTYAGVYSRRDLLVDGIVAVLVLAALVCMVIGLAGDF